MGNNNHQNLVIYCRPNLVGAHTVLYQFKMPLEQHFTVTNIFDLLYQAKPHYPF